MPPVTFRLPVTLFNNNTIPLLLVRTGVFRSGGWSPEFNYDGTADVLFLHGITGDIPAIGDWNGDGVDTTGMYRNGMYYLRYSNTNGVLT